MGNSFVRSIRHQTSQPLTESEYKETKKQFTQLFSSGRPNTIQQQDNGVSVKLSSSHYINMESGPSFDAERPHLVVFGYARILSLEESRKDMRSRDNLITPPEGYEDFDMSPWDPSERPAKQKLRKRHLTEEPKQQDRVTSPPSNPLQKSSTTKAQGWNWLIALVVGSLVILGIWTYRKHE